MKTALACICLAAGLMLAACTPPTQYAAAKPDLPAQPPVQRERHAYLERMAQAPVTCTNGTDCDQKWARALAWVNQHSSYSIKTSTDIEIATNGPIEPTTDAAFTITRGAGANANTTAIYFSCTCGKDARCSPTVLELATSFNNYVTNGQ